MKRAKNIGLPRLKIYTDSKFIVKIQWINEKKHEWKTSEGGLLHNRDLLKAVDGIRNEVDVDFQQIYHHRNIMVTLYPVKKLENIILNDTIDQLSMDKNYDLCYN